MSRIVKIPSASPFFDKESIQNILRDIESTLQGGVLTEGPHVKDFEEKFAKYLKVEHAIAVSSGTSALEISLRYFKLKGREVIVPTNTFVATPNSVLFAGGKPIFADINKDTLCIDLNDIESKISSRTAGTIVVHIAGLICPQIKKIKELCEDHRIFLLEDSAHAHGATIEGEKAGSLGNAGCFSFYPTKVMTTGEGGMITTNDPKLAEESLCMRSHGQDKQRRMVMLGHNWRMSEIAAIIGKYQLKNLEKIVCKRNEIAKKYEVELNKIDDIKLFKVPNNIRHSYYKYPVLLSNDIDREKLAYILQKEYNIETGNVYYPPCHLHPFYQENLGTKEGDLPAAEKVLKKVICLPMYVEMTEEIVKHISEALISSIEEIKVKN